MDIHAKPGWRDRESLSEKQKTSQLKSASKKRWA
jgi:hypothetical protein